MDKLLRYFVAISALIFLNYNNAYADTNYVYASESILVQYSTIQKSTLDAPGSPQLPGYAVDYQQIMAGNLLKGDKLPFYVNGDTRFTFDANDNNAYIEIDLGLQRSINQIGAGFCGNKTAGCDRPVIGPVSYWVSLDGSKWQQYGGLVDPNAASHTVSSGLINARYIKWVFGHSGDYFSQGGAAITDVFVSKS